MGKIRRLPIGGEDYSGVNTYYTIENNPEEDECLNAAIIYSPGCATTYCVTHDDGVIQVSEEEEEEEERCKYTEGRKKTIIKVVRVD